MNGFILPPILRPAGRRYFLLLLPSIDGEIEQPVTIVHRLDPAARRPICFEDVGTPAQIADEVHAADLAAGQQYVARSEEHTSELTSLMRISSDVFYLKNKHTNTTSQITIISIHY